jgi:hypothetical protein
MSDQDDLFAQLEDCFAAVDAEGIQSVQDKNEAVLRDRLIEIEGELTRLGQLLWQHSQPARDLHSERVAIKVDLQRREDERGQV